MRQDTMQLHTYGFSNKCIWRLKYKVSNLIWILASYYRPQTGTGCGQEAREEGGEAGDVHPELEGRGGGEAPQYPWGEGVGQRGRVSDISENGPMGLNTK